MEKVGILRTCCEAVWKKVIKPQLWGENAALADTCGCFNFTAAPWWAEPQICPKSSFLYLHNNEMWCPQLESIFLKVPAISSLLCKLPISPLYHPRLSESHGPAPPTCRPKTSVPKGTKIRPVWNNFILVCWWISSGSSLFCSNFLNLAYNYATTIPAGINQPSKPKHVHLYPNVIYLKCHVGVSIMHYYIGFYFLLK